MGAFVRSNFGHVKFKMASSFYPLKNDKNNIPKFNRGAYITKVSYFLNLKT